MQPCARRADWIVDPWIQRGDNQRKSEPKGSSPAELSATLAACPGWTLLHTVANGYWGLLYEERGRGPLERYPEDKAKELVKNDDWNDFVISAKGKHFTIDFNGTRIIDRTDEKFADEGVFAV